MPTPPNTPMPTAPAPWGWHSGHARRPHVPVAQATGAQILAWRGTPRPTAPAGRQCLRGGPAPPRPRRPISAAARTSPSRRLARPCAVSPARGAGAGVNEVEAIPPPPVTAPPPPRPPRSDAARPLGAQSSSCPPAGCALRRTLASDSPGPDPESRTHDGQAQLAVHPHRGREEPARQGHVSAAGGGNPNFPGRGAAPYA